MKGLQLAMAFLAGIALVGTTTCGVDLLLQPAPRQADLVLITGGSGPYWQRVVEGAEAEARESGVALHVEIVSDSDAADAQRALLERLASERHGAVAICPLKGIGQSSALDELSRASRVLAYLRDVPHDGLVCRALPGEYTDGKKAADLAVDALPEGGTVVALMPPGSQSKERLAGLSEQLRVRCRQLATVNPAFVLKTIDMEPAEWAHVQGMLDQTLESSSGRVCIVLLDESRIGDVLRVVEHACKAIEPKVIVLGQSHETIDAVAAGRVSAAIVHDPLTVGRQTVVILARFCRSDELALPVAGRGSVAIPSQVVDACNVDDFRSRVGDLPVLPST